MNEFKISIIIPVYNVSDFIVECLESVFRQSMQKGVECILVDDCTPDDSVKLAVSAINQYKGEIDFKILHHEKNRGLSAARNTGTLVAKGEYVYYLDSDDYIYDNTLQLLWDIVQKYEGVDIVQGSTYDKFMLSSKKYPEYSNDRLWIRKSMCSLMIPDPAWNRLVRRIFILDNDILFAEGYIQEDTLWSFHLQKHIKDIAFCFEKTYFYRYNPNGIMHGSGIMKEARSFAIIYNKVYNEMLNSRKEPYEIQYLNWIQKRIYNLIGKESKSLLNSNNNRWFQLSCNLDKARYGHLFTKVLLIIFPIDKMVRRILCNDKFFSHKKLNNALTLY